MILTFAMLMISIYLNFTRCTFIDIFVGITFFGNVFIWRIFNIFLAVKLIVVLLISIIIDIFWESIRLYHYHSNYEDTMKRL